MKRVTPYERLKDRARVFANGVFFRTRKPMWTYPKDKLTSNWNLSDLWERTAAAHQMGWEVRLSATDAGIVVEYLEGLPKRPWEF